MPRNTEPPELKVSVSHDEHSITVAFEQPISHFSIDPDYAIELAQHLILPAHACRYPKAVSIPITGRKP